jgi:hypothetical protein
MNIIVPIHIEALRVSPSSSEKAKTALYDFSLLGQRPASAMGNLIAANRFQSAQVGLGQEPGVHLHWSLPKAYTHGVQDEVTGAVNFPILPNRWLVIRFFKDNTKTNNNTRIRLWMLESDAHSNLDTLVDSSTIIPWMNDPGDLQGIQPNFMGRKIDLDANWTEAAQAGALPGANAGDGQVRYLGEMFQAPFGYGETFTAYYQNCGNILGLWDQFDDYFTNPNQLEIDSNFTASYAVMGWVNTIAADQCDITLVQAVSNYQKMTGTKPSFPDYIQQVIEQQLSWSLSDYSGFTADNAGQVQATMSGMLSDVSWQITQPGSPVYPTAIPSIDNIQVAVGNNTAEALSAYINAVESVGANETGGVTSNIEWLLNALQFSQLHKLSAGDVGVGQLEEFLHGTAFSGESGGYLWSARLKMAPGQPKPPAGDNEVTLPAYLAKLLSQLNIMQRSLDRARDEIASRRTQLFFDWNYHISQLDTQVISGGGNLSDDNTGNFLVDGLLQLFPALLNAGNFVEAGTPAAPYAPQADGFNMALPDDGPVANLSSYGFNASDNQVAAGFTQSMLGAGLRIDEVGDSDLPDAMAALKLARTLLVLYQAGGSGADEYLQDAIKQLGNALASLGDAVATFAALHDGGAGLAAQQSALDAAQKTLDGFTDPSGVFATQLKYTPDPGKAPLPPGQSYAGKIRSPVGPLMSWDQPVGAFPGMKAQMDIFAGQNGQPQHLLDIQHAALYLGFAYFYAKSGTPFICSSAYYLQMAEQTIQAASSTAGSASSVLNNAIAALNGSALTKMADALQQIVTTSIPKIQADLSAKQPDVSSALGELKILLTPTKGGDVSLPDIMAGLFTEDWQTLRNGVYDANLTVAERLPKSQQVAQWNQFLYQQIADKYELQASPADHYYFPNEPVVLLAEQQADGNVLAPFMRNGRATRVPCRLDTEIVAASGSVTFPPQISGLSKTISTGIAGLDDVLQQLAEESYLLTPELSSTVSAANLQAAAQSNEDTQYDKLNGITLNDAPAGLTGKLPYYVAYNWQSGEDPFLPLFIWWEADYQYSQKYSQGQQTYTPDFLSQFELGQYDVELQPSSAAMAQFNRNTGTPNFFTAHGLISLSSASTFSLCTQIQVYCQTYLNYDPATGPPQPSLPDYEEAEKFYKAYEDYKTRNFLSQGLSGFDPALVQRAQELQIPITIPPSWTNPASHNIPLGLFWPTSFLHQQSDSWPVTWNDLGINNDAFASGNTKVYFNPLRAGFLQLTQITLVDAFGRFVDLKNPNPEMIAESMLASQPAPQGHGVYLAPRLVQPARLDFDWLSAESSGGIDSFTELGDQPAASPVCGWIWPNHLDDSLMLYDVDGVPLGSLRTRGSKLHWFPVPGETTEVGANNRDQMVQYFAAKRANPVYSGFITQFLYADETADTDRKFQNFLTVLQKSQQFIVTAAMQMDQALSVLMGRPLVVTQASLSLSQKGTPYVGLDSLTYPVWNQFGPQFTVNSSAYIPYNFDNFNLAGIPELEVPVRIGTAEIQTKNGSNIPYFDDGVAGYFVSSDWKTLYTPVEIDDSDGIVSVSAPGSHPISLVPGGPAATVTLVMDPRAAAHATTGILPVQSITIPSDQYSQILNALEITFLTAPVLAAQHPPAIPLPMEKDYNWYWVQIGENAAALRPAQGVTDAVFPQHPQQLVDGWLKLLKS